MIPIVVFCLFIAYLYAICKAVPVKEQITQTYLRFCAVGILVGVIPGGDILGGRLHIPCTRI